MEMVEGAGAAHKIDRPMSISGLTGLAKDEEIKNVLVKARAGMKDMESCGGVAGGWGN
jgi:hypothetical protein